MTQPAFRQWVEAKVDLINQKVIVRKTEHHVGWTNQTDDVRVFCLARGGAWLAWEEGKAYPDACELPIYKFRDEDRECPVCGCVDGAFINRRWECFRCYRPDKAMIIED